MESLVEEEVKQLIQTLPKRVSAWIYPEDLVTHALNRLPPLYASSKEGVGYQLRKGKSELKEQITQAVHRAFATVQNDPLRRRTPLQAPHLQDSKKAEFQQQSFNQLKVMAVDGDLQRLQPQGLGGHLPKAELEGRWPESQQLRKTENRLTLFKHEDVAQSQETTMEE